MDKPTHYRRCHVCGTTNKQSSDPVIRCTTCGKSLAPFFYFDDKRKVVFSDMHPRPPLMQGEYSPIQGLTAYWESF